MVEAGKEREQEQRDALSFVCCPAECIVQSPRIAIENPIGKISTAIRKPDQIIQPWQFGHGETKATCLWLKGLPLLEPTNIVEGRKARIHRMPPGPNRSRDRSRTYPGHGRSDGPAVGRPMTSYDQLQTDAKETQ